MDTSIEQKPDLLAHYPSTKKLDIPMTETPHSSQVSAYGFDPEHNTLRVRFKWGASEYDYHHLSAEVAAEFAAAKSKGSFLKEHIKGVYHFECTRPREDKRA